MAVQVKCYHCGDACTEGEITSEEKSFCCSGCKTVFEIFSENDLTCYYDFQQNPGATPPELKGKFDYLDNTEIQQKLVDFSDDGVESIQLFIPHIHCSSCIWILENLNKLNPQIISSQVNFPEKKIHVTYKTASFNLKDLVTLLASIGYEPYLSLETMDRKKTDVDRSLIYKIGIAGFAFGNVMFLSFPEYFEVSEYWLEQYKPIFRWLMFFFSLPVVFYSGAGYFVSAYKGIKTKILNIDVPIALGISVLFIRSSIEIMADLGTGFFDSLTGLVFFLLLGKLVQQKTYTFLSFERDYKSYFPIAVTKLNHDDVKEEENIPIYEIKKGDRILIRSGELIPVDGILVEGDAKIDYSFVTGEARTVHKNKGEKLYAGGKQQLGAIEVIAEKEVEQSYLTQLWSQDAFTKNNELPFQSLIDQISKHFTWAVLSIAFVSTTFWLIYDASLALNVLTAVLIIACPCAIALATPFTLGNLLRIFGKRGFYLKNTETLEQLASLDAFVFDKTGTLSSSVGEEIAYQGENLTEEDYSLLRTTLRNSNHPLSRKLYAYLKSQNIDTLDEFEEEVGKGIKAKINSKEIKLGSSQFVNVPVDSQVNETAVYFSEDEAYRGKFTFSAQYRDGIWDLMNALADEYQIQIVSGDNQAEEQYLKSMLPKVKEMYFNQQPKNKLERVKALQDKKLSVAMIGDGLNDAGALKQSNVGIAVAENINVFTPACDGIIDAKKLTKLNQYIDVAKSGKKIIKWAFFFSFLYNVVGLYFAVTGQLTPIIAAILMPLSSISIVAFTSLASKLVSKKLSF
ncbi:heavy metal translocating P-type ATPase [Psychroflexus planctonicus]|uniref:ATPase n=1 Tax=Psychroflexus planctonicus TaxID=1526575 RepID=A0ABQ1SP10_9FLAO|nr:heavy metal translocating P-type ATPase metal-binding domain-containing protein [Psychroflexus planctonicus]GGE44244.1 ATPase [Psychroflexus planctonicus]